MLLCLRGKKISHKVTQINVVNLRAFVASWQTTATYDYSYSLLFKHALREFAEKI
ncbi:Uncharacterized protein dnm_029030 [Desulfonema magnum]|uniref:Uncharacterized protein n=1 Tax=Desulfonema magnum TaxID=45655 RepID=A0A975GNH3_9BACT|nr:Uncharacterized protein dnm_029030 [Desulfonema magnum]